MDLNATIVFDQLKTWCDANGLALPEVRWNLSDWPRVAGVLHREVRSHTDSADDDIALFGIPLGPDAFTQTQGYGRHHVKCVCFLCQDVKNPPKERRITGIRQVLDGTPSGDAGSLYYEEDKS